MTSKGYANPLHALDLTPHPEDRAKEVDRFEVIVPEGRLVVSPVLLRQAKKVSSDTCAAALGQALRAHAPLAESFGPLGLGPDWRRSMEHWGHQMMELDALRIDQTARMSAMTCHRQQLFTQGQALWARLALVAGLAGMPRRPVTGQAPRAEGPLLLSLAHAKEVLASEGTRALLSRHGFGPEEKERLEDVLRELRPLAQDLLRAAWERSGTSRALLTVRGALIGDLCRLARMAQASLWPEYAARLDQRLLLRGERGGGERKGSAKVEPPVPPLR